MAKQSMADLQAENEALRAERDAALRKAANKDDAFAVIAWFNDKATKENRQPEYRSTFRFVIPAGVNEGDPIWLDLGLYAYDPETCPYHFAPDGDLPELTGSIKPTVKDIAAIKEAGFVEARKEKAAQQR